MAVPETFGVQTQRQQASVASPGLAPIRSAGPSVRPATTAQAGSISYVGAQVAEESAASQYSRAKGAATTDWLLKAAGNVIAPYMQSLQSAQVMKGIQEAAAGKSIDEIRDTPPWYSRIFGDSDLVSAARAYKAQEAVTSFVTQVQREIPNMGNLSPAEARAAMTAKWKEFQTGDVLTDTVANQQFLNAAPGLFEQYQKQNYKNWQENARSAQQQAYSAMSTNYNQKAMTNAVDGTVSLDDVLKTGAEMIAGLAPVDGQTFESWSGNLIGTVQDAVNQGAFHSVNNIMKSGLVDKLPPDQQAQLQAYIRQGESRSILDARISPTYAAQIADLQLQLRTGQMSPADVFSRTNAINVAAKAQFGYSMPMIGPDEVESWMGVSTNLVSNEINHQRTTSIQNEQRMAQQTANMEAKADADRREIELGAKRFSSGGLIPPGESVEPTKKAGGAMFDKMEATEPGSGYRSLASLYAHNNGLVIPSLQARFQAGLQTSDKMEWTPEFDASTTKPFMDMIAQPGGTNAAVQYFGAQNYKKMDSYLAAMKNGVPQPLAYHEAFVKPQRLGDTSSLNKQDREALSSELSPSWFTSFFKDNMSDSAQATVMQSASAHLADLKENSRYTDESERVKTAINLALHDGNIAVYGSWAWDRDRTAKPLHEQVGLSSNQMYGVLGARMKSMVQFKGTDIDKASFIERTDENGRSTLFAYVPTGDGKFRIGSISADEIAETARSIRTEQRNERAQRQQWYNAGKEKGGTIYGMPLKP